MKRETISAIILLCALAFPAKGQSSAGVKTDVNLSNLWISKSEELENVKKMGGSAGFFYTHVWLENRAIQADLLFRYRSSEFENSNSGESADFRYFGVELPAYIMWYVDLDNNKFYTGMGPFASFGLSSRCKSDNLDINLYKKDPMSDKAMTRRWDFGIGYILGYETKFNLQFNFNFQLGFKNLIDAARLVENEQMNSRLISLGVGYRF